MRCPIRIQLPIVFLAAFCLSGCGGSTEEIPIAPVSGTVTLNGEPLPEAHVIFTPTEKGRPSIGVTNEEGVYELTFRGTQSGAVIGSHRVGISTVAPESTGVEMVPDEYQEPGALTATVEQGENEINFELEGTSPERKVGEPQSEDGDDSV